MNAIGTLMCAPGTGPTRRRCTSSGPTRMHQRTIAVDTERAPLIRWAFTTYATGDCSVEALRDELEKRGLTSRATPKRPSKALRTNQVHRFLQTHGREAARAPALPQVECVCSRPFSSRTTNKVLSSDPHEYLSS
jgi:hypothetical protein